MEFVFLSLLSLAVLHFIYEGIIAPSVRLKLRFELFELRDNLRSRCLSDDSAAEVFSIQQAAINNSIRMVPRADFSSLWNFRRKLQRDESLKLEIQERLQKIEAYGCPSFQAIVDATHRVFLQAFAVNSGAWAFYIIPLALIFTCFKRVAEYTKDVLSIPERDLASTVGGDIATVAV